MNKAELISNVSTKSGLTKKDTTTVIEAIMNEITQALALSEDVNISGFGKFSVVETAERNGRNPATQESLIIPAGKKAKFKASSNLKELINS